MGQEKNMKAMKIGEFIDVLASKEAVPGGGGASALSGAVGIALGSMVGSLTVGKKRYAQVEEEIKEEMKKAKALQKKLLQLMDDDAAAFEPLSKAYGLPKNTEEEAAYRNQVMEQALMEASMVPIEIMDKAMEGLQILRVMAEKGSRLAVSDVGVGAQFCRAALLGASLNVFINTKLMKDRERAENLNQKADKIIQNGVKEADEIFEIVMQAIRPLDKGL